MKMPSHTFPVGLEMDVSYPNFKASLTLQSVTQLRFEIKDGPFAKIEIVGIQVVPLGNGMFAVSWQEKDGALVCHAVEWAVPANDRDTHDHPVR
jgi:hypothetical protein